MRNYISRLIKKLADFFRPTYKAQEIEELPELLNKKTVYAIGAPLRPWALAFLCPCGCKAVIQLNLLKEAKPRWNYKISDNGIITVHPSIWRKEGCQSHFFIRQGKIVWC